MAYNNAYWLAVENGFTGSQAEYEQAQAATNVEAEVLARDAADQILKSDITANSLNISTNAAAIGTNASNIASNAAQIAANKAKLDSIETMEADELSSIVDSIFGS